jgi:hypothetical protein
MGGVGGVYVPPTPPKNLVLRDCTVNHPLYAIALLHGMAAEVNARMNAKIKISPFPAFTGGYAVNLKTFNSRYKTHKFRKVA